VSSHDQKAHVERQLGRLRDFAAARGYRVTRAVVDIASGLNDQRPKFNQLLSVQAMGTILIEHKDWATRFGFSYIALLLEGQERRIEVANEVKSKDELVDDFGSLITSMVARIDGRRSSRPRAEPVSPGSRRG
jgi:putative resolvase